MIDNVAGDASYKDVKKVMVCGAATSDCKYDKPLIWDGIECVLNADGAGKDGKLGTQKITQKIVQQDFGGVPCKTPDSNGNIVTIQSCNPDPINCTLSNWEDQGNRDAKCGIGSIVQSRKINVKSAYGGTCGPYNDRGETILTRVDTYDTKILCPTSSPTPTPTSIATSSPTPSTTQSPTPSPTPSTTLSPTSSSAMTTSPTSSNTMVYAAVGVVVLGIGIYFYLSKKAK